MNIPLVVVPLPVGIHEMNEPIGRIANSGSGTDGHDELAQEDSVSGTRVELGEAGGPERRSVEVLYEN